MDAAEKLIEAVMEAGLESVLPSGIPMHKHNVTKRWSRLDQVFLSAQSNEMLTTCSTLLEQRGINTDHLPILMVLRLEVAITEAKAIPNFFSVNWEDFRYELRKQLDKAQVPAHISNQMQLDEHCEELTEALQEAIRVVVPAEKPMSKSKRWWTKELSQLRTHTNKLGRAAYKLRGDPEHRAHEEHKVAKSKYQNAIKVTKQQHWRDWLEKAEDPDIWAAHHIVSAPHIDRGKAKIPKLKYKVGDQELTASTNEEKSGALTKCFFPIKPQDQGQNAEVKYPKACKGVGRITREQI
jgi:hypothetical protein